MSYQAFRTVVYHSDICGKNFRLGGQKSERHYSKGIRKLIFLIKVQGRTP